MSSIGYQCSLALLTACAASVRKSDFREIRTFVFIARTNGISQIPSPQVPTYLMILAARTQSLSLRRKRVRIFMVVDNWSLTLMETILFLYISVWILLTQYTMRLSLHSKNIFSSSCIVHAHCLRLQLFGYTISIISLVCKGADLFSLIWENMCMQKCKCGRLD